MAIPPVPPKILLIDGSTCTALVPKSDALDEAWYIQYVPLQQILYLRPILFPKYYIDFLNRFDVGLYPTPGGLTEAETFIYFEFMQPMLAWYTVAAGMPTLWAHIGSKSISVAKEANSESVTYTEMAMMQNDYRNYAETYAQALRTYLNENHKDFPPYEAEGYKDPSASASVYASSFIFIGAVDPRFRGYK